MIETPQLVTTTAVSYAGLRQQFPVAEVQQRMGPLVQRVAAVLQKQGAPPVGPWFSHHFHRPMQTFDMEVCFPVAEPIQPAGDVLPQVWPETRVVRTVFHGNYSGLAGVWGELEKWIKEQGLATREEFWEVYQVNPNDTPDAEAWRTELNWPVV